MESNLLEQIRKTDARVFAFGAIAFLALIGPVMLEIFIADPALYKELDLSKLILLSIGATLPTAALNILLCSSATKHIDSTPILPGTPDLNTTAGFFITAFVFYIDIGIQFLVDYSFHTFVLVGIVLEFIVIFWSIPQILDANKKTLTT